MGHWTDQIPIPLLRCFEADRPLVVFDLRDLDHALRVGSV